MNDQDLNFKSKKSRKTFAPSSQVHASDILKPSMGQMISVAVAWKDRVIFNRCFENNKKVFVGYDSNNDIVVPIGEKSRCFIQNKGSIQVFLSFNMSGELVKSDGSRETLGDITRRGEVEQKEKGIWVSILQGEMLIVQSEELSFYITYGNRVKKPLLVPFLDFSTPGVTGVLLAIAVTAIFWCYMLIYVPGNIYEDGERVEERIRLARVSFKSPVKRVKIREKVAKKGNKTRKKAVIKKKEKTVVRKKVKARRTSKRPTKKRAKSAAVRPKKTKVTKKTYTSARKGGAVRTGKRGGNLKSKKDVTKVGLLSVFGSGGRKSFDKTSQGVGELVGLADSATGSAGFKEDRGGDNFGTKQIGSGAGGKGASVVGISGLGTKGKGTGNYGAASGGLGKKGDVGIDVGGDDEDIEGFLDKEAIRRVVIRNKRAIRYCYEYELNRDKNLYGKIILSWEIVSRGSVNKVRVKSNTLGTSTPARAVASCIVRRLKTWKFPSPPKNVIGEVTFPFVFTSR